MKKFVICVCVLILITLTIDILYYRFGLYINLNFNKEIEVLAKSDEKNIYIRQGDNYEKIEIKGVDMGVGIPGHFATDYAIDKETYLRWFKQIQELGANTIRVYTILQDDFYNAFYEYNKNNSKPLYLIHGLWVNDYVQFSSIDAYNEKFLGKMLEDVRIVSDVIHGKRKIMINRAYGSGNYTKDISKWVIGYILGVEWEDVTVAYTNHLQEGENSYVGKYMYTTEDASAFEAMLTQVGERLFEYETNRYGEQRLVAFSNWPTTDPFEYEQKVKEYFKKIACVDVEHIKVSDKVKSGTFASYHIYPYYPDYLSYISDVNTFIDENGNLNTYKEYLKKINEYHSIPVIISEYGVSSARGMAQRDRNTGRNQGGMSEEAQGKAIVECYRDIKEAGCAGSIVFTWQDEWFKRTWNTMHSVDLQKTPYWSDYQTNEQYFGLLSFDPGEKESICYVDGNISEWKEEDIVKKEGESYISVKYDEKFIYFMVHNKGLEENKKLYIPIGTTPKTGTTYCENYDLKFNDDVDFLIVIDGIENSRVMVQERYENMRAIFSRNVYGYSAYDNVPDKSSPVFKAINLLLQTATPLETGDVLALSEYYETGKLQYGNANPTSTEFNSLADFCIKGDNIEIKIPWQLLNFSNPSEMKIHDDYYEKYGVEEIQIDEMKVGLITDENENERVNLGRVKLNGWKTNVTYHERLKQSYYILKEEWSKE